MGYLAQHQMEQRTAERTVIEELVAQSPTTNLGTLRSLAGAFGFHGDDDEKPIRILSGGFVSHDRAFLRAIATRILELSAKGPHVYGGSYDEYVATTGREAPPLGMTSPSSV